MANLKGGTYSKQIKDAFHRMAAFGVKRYGKEDHLTHSDALASKREMFLRDFSSFVSERGFTAKLNLLMGNETVMNDFLCHRLEGLSFSTAENYLRGFASMIYGLREKNVTISDKISKNYFDRKVCEVKTATQEKVTRTDRAIEDPHKVISNLYDLNYASGVVANVLNELGIRISEAYELIRNHQEYIREEKVIGLVGKGNHIYIPKSISSELIHKITLVEKLPSQDTFREHLKQITDGKHKPHDFRFTMADRLFHQKLAQGIDYHQALKEVSSELNHSRAEMTNYYLSRA